MHELDAALTFVRAADRVSSSEKMHLEPFRIACGKAHPLR
jgi:hypothetical protein